jgi:hypothetical protein
MWSLNSIESRGLLVVFVAALAVVARPTSVKAQDSLADLHRFTVDCVLVGSTGSCRGDIGTATISDTASSGATLGTDGQGDACKLDGSRETLTDPSGSSLTLKTSGTTCFSPSVAFNLRHNGYQITGGTGRFAAATGVGVFVVGPSVAGSYLVHIEGNILYGD